MSMPRGKKKGLSTKKFDRCVTKVKRKGGGKNPYAICKLVWVVNRNQTAKVRVARKSNTKL
jgi:hypothetical protein